MAVVARAPVSSRLDGVKIALIVFVCLTVASLAVTITIYTKYSDMQAAVDQAGKQYTNANAETNKTRQTMRDLAQTVLGEATDEPEKLKQSIATAMKPIADDEQVKKAGIAADSTMLTALQGIFKVYSANAQELAKTVAERDELNNKLTALNTAAEKRAKEFADKTQQFEQQYQQLEQRGAANQEAWNTQVEDLKKKLDAASASASQQLSGERQQRQKLEQAMAEKDKRVKEMAEKLAKFQPTGEKLSLMQIADGTVVRAVANEDIVYISLGRKDQIRPGMPFAVYSSVRGVGEDGKEKASIEVTTVFDTTSEARVTNRTPGDPILEGDAIANVVYDRNRQFNFFVAGDFDLNFDGKVDDPGGENVAKLIAKWGGKVVDAVDTRVDFVVLGAPPPMPVKAVETDNDAAKQHAAEREVARKAFETAKDEAKAMSIPILTRTQFLHFLGTVVPAKAKDDQVAIQ